MAKPPIKQLKVGLRVRDLDRVFDLYQRLGFRHLPVPGQAQLRYLTYGSALAVIRAFDAAGRLFPQRT